MAPMSRKEQEADALRQEKRRAEFEAAEEAAYEQEMANKKAGVLSVAEQKVSIVSTFEAPCARLAQCRRSVRQNRTLSRSRLWTGLSSGGASAERKGWQPTNPMRALLLFSLLRTAVTLATALLVLCCCSAPSLPHPHPHPHPSATTGAGVGAEDR